MKMKPIEEEKNKNENVVFKCILYYYWYRVKFSFIITNASY